MEKTLPIGASKNETFLCLETIFQKGGCSIAFSSSNADGGKDRDGMRTQMVQHCKALRLVSTWSRDPSHRLSADQVCGLHRLLMLNSIDEKGAPLPAGEVRKCGAFTVGHIYPEASMAGLEQAIEKYYVSQDRKDHFLISAAVLFMRLFRHIPFRMETEDLRSASKLHFGTGWVSIRCSADIGAF